MEFWCHGFVVNYVQHCSVLSCQALTLSSLLYCVWLLFFLCISMPTAVTPIKGCIVVELCKMAWLGMRGGGASS